MSERWISTADRLPGEEQEVLAVKELKDGRRSICIARCLLEFEHYDPVTLKKYKAPYWVCGGNNNVIYWMDLPEVPNE